MTLICAQIKDLRERLEEAESVGVRKMKSQMQAMEEKIRGLEEQLDTANKLVMKCWGEGLDTAKI